MLQTECRHCRVCGPLQSRLGLRRTSKIRLRWMVFVWMRRQMMTMKFLNVVYSHCMKPAVVKVSSYYHNRMSAYSVVDLTSTLHRIHGNAKPSAPILQLFVPLLSSTVATALFSTQIFFLWSLQTADSFR